MRLLWGVNELKMSSPRTGPTLNRGHISICYYYYSEVHPGPFSQQPSEVGRPGDTISNFYLLKLRTGKATSPQLQGRFHLSTNRALPCRVSKAR